MSRALLVAVAAITIGAEAAAQVPPAPPAAIAGSHVYTAARAPRAGWARGPRFHRTSSDRPGLDSAQASAFLTALSQSAPAVCEMAVDNLGNWGWNDGVRSLRDQSAATRNDRLLFGRAEAGESAVPVLAKGLSRQDACSRRAAARLLGQSDLASASRALRDAARNADGRVREAALLGIGIREDSANYQTATQGLGDRDPEVVRMAAWAVGEYERPESVPLLLPLLKRSEPNIRLAAVRALGMIESDSVTSHLVAAMKDQDAEVRRAAAEGLGNR